MYGLKIKIQNSWYTDTKPKKNTKIKLRQKKKKCVNKFAEKCLKMCIVIICEIKIK